MAVSRRQVGVILLALLGAIALLAFSPEAQSQPVADAVDHGPGGVPYVAGELLVTYKEQASDAAVESLDEEVGAEVEETLPEIDTRLFEFPEVKNEPSQDVRERILEQIKEALEKDPAVQSAGYNYLYSANNFPADPPNDPKFPDQWSLSKTDFENAWSSTLGSEVRIAIVDSGAYVRHEDLRQQIALQRDFVKKGDDTAEDPFGHGTHVAGIAAADTNNRKGVAGGCPDCELLIAKVLNQNGYGNAADLAQGIVWSARKGAKVINISIGGEPKNDALKRAVVFATNRGAVVVAAAGNDHTSTPRYPAAYPGVIAVAATNEDDKRASFSNYGDWVDVAAPGVRVLSTVPGGYYKLSGTSMAAPHVSALAGLLASQRLDQMAIKRRIFSTAVDLGKAGRDPYFGYGRIDAGRAVR